MNGQKINAILERLDRLGSAGGVEGGATAQGSVLHTDPLMSVTIDAFLVPSIGLSASLKRHLLQQESGGVPCFWVVSWIPFEMIFKMRL